MTNISSTVVYFSSWYTWYSNDKYTYDTEIDDNLCEWLEKVLGCYNPWHLVFGSLPTPAYTLNVGIPMSAWDEGKLDEDDGK